MNPVLRPRRILVPEQPIHGVASACGENIYKAVPVDIAKRLAMRVARICLIDNQVHKPHQTTQRGLHEEDSGGRGNRSKRIADNAAVSTSAICHC